jgi:phage replication O-like protein O
MKTGAMIALPRYGVASDFTIQAENREVTHTPLRSACFFEARWPERGIFMASPQLEHGYTKIANELLEALATAQMSGSEWQYVMCLIRKTYGFRKKEDWVTNTQVMQMTGLRKERVSEAKSRLVERGIVTENRNKISLNKNYELWQELRKSVTPVTEIRNKLLRKSVPTKEKKENINISAATAALKINSSLTDMSFKNRRRYNEDGHWDEPSLDADTLEPLTAKEEQEDAVEKEHTRAIRHNLRLLEGTRGLSFGVGKDFNYHAKIYRELLKNGWSHEAIALAFIEILDSPHWKEKMEMGEYPGMNTVQFQLRNKKPV